VKLIIKENVKLATNVFDDMGVFWAEIADKNHTERQIQFLKNNLNKKGLILDLACGTGRHLIPLSAKGYRLIGVDSSLKLLRIAKQRCPRIDVIRVDLRCLPFKKEIFEAAISMDTSIGYLPTETDDIQSMIELNRTLVKGGTFFVDVFNIKLLKHKYGKKGQIDRVNWFGIQVLLKICGKRVFRFLKLKEYPSFYLLQRRLINSDSKKLEDLWFIYTKNSEKVIKFKHKVRLYEHEELEGMLSKSEFKVKCILGGYEHQEFSTESTRLILITTK
jgi:SAM-dependent methyltransferase